MHPSQLVTKLTVAVALGAAISACTVADLASAPPGPDASIDDLTVFAADHPCKPDWTWGGDYFTYVQGCGLSQFRLHGVPPFKRVNLWAIGLTISGDRHKCGEIKLTAEFWGGTPFGLYQLGTLTASSEWSEVRQVCAGPDLEWNTTNMVNGVTATDFMIVTHSVGSVPTTAATGIVTRPLFSAP